MGRDDGLGRGRGTVVVILDLGEVKWRLIYARERARTKFLA
jgi:hypothetical protein